MRVPLLPVLGLALNTALGSASCLWSCPCSSYCCGCEAAFCAQYVALLAEGEPRQLREFVQQHLAGGARGGSPPRAPRTQMST